MFKNPEAIIFYMAFSPLFVDPGQAGVAPSLPATGTIAAITLADGLTVGALAQRLLPRLTSQRQLEHDADALPAGRGFEAVNL